MSITIDNGTGAEVLRDATPGVGTGDPGAGSRAGSVAEDESGTEYTPPEAEEITAPSGTEVLFGDADQAGIETAVRTAGDFDYWSYVVPYYDVELDSGETISSFVDNYDTVWYTFFSDTSQLFEEEDSTQVTNALDSTNTNVSYSIVNDRTRKAGTFSMMISGHDQSSYNSSANYLNYMVMMSYGGVGFPVFPNYVTENGALEYASYTSFLDVEYSETEVEVIQDNWQKQSFVNQDGLPSSFEESYNSFVSQLASDAYNQTNKGEPRFLFQKTNEKVINLNKLSAFTSVSYTISSAEARTTQATTTTSYAAASTEATTANESLSPTTSVSDSIY